MAHIRPFAARATDLPCVACVVTDTDRNEVNSATRPFPGAQRGGPSSLGEIPGLQLCEVPHHAAPLCV